MIILLLLNTNYITETNFTIVEQPFRFLAIPSLARHQRHFKIEANRNGIVS